jgi:hypothetical protein
MEPMVTVSTKNLNHCNIWFKTSRVSFDIKDYNNYLSYYKIDVDDAERVSFAPTKTTGGEIYFRTINVEYYKFLPNECRDLNYTLYAMQTRNVQVVTDETSEKPSQNINARLLTGYFGGRLEKYELENLYFRLGNDEDNSTWEVVPNGRLDMLPAVFNLTTNEKGTVIFGTTVTDKGQCYANLKPNAVMTLNKDMFWDFAQNCDPEKTYLWDHETNRATEIS